MNPVARVLPGFMLLAAAAVAQVPPAPVVNIAPVVVEEEPLTASASGLTQVRLDATAPTATRSLSALATRVANLHLNAGGAGSYGDVLTLRGLPNTPFFSDPSVAVYFDDLPLGSAFTYPTGLFGFGIAAIERGPQGIDYARGGEAGAIIFQSNEPRATAGGEARASVGNFNARTGGIEAHSARTERADVVVSASLQERDGYIWNPTLGRRIADQRAYSGAARFRLRPTATSEISLQLLGNQLRHGEQPLLPLGGPLFTVARDRAGETQSDFAGGALKAAFDTSLGRLAATTSRTTWTLSPYDNRLTLPPTLDSRIDHSQRIWNQELRLSSDPRSLVVWHVGAWFSDGETEGAVNRAIPGVGPIEVSAFTLDSRTKALFAAITIPPNIGWSITAGVRLEETERDFTRSQSVPSPARFTAQRTFRSFEPKLSASYAFPNNVTASASVSLGAKPGGWSAYTGNPALAGFRAEKMTAFEAGLEAALADNRVTLAARVFAYAIRDYQIERSFNATDYLVVNAPRARSLGGEIEATWKPLPELILTATLGLTDVQLRRFTDPFTGRSYAGNRAPYAPDYEAHLAATYRAKEGIFAAVELAATGETFYSEAEDPRFASDAHAVVNARLGYDTPRWRLTVFGENLADEGYYALVIPGVRHAAPGAPRTWGVEAAVKW